MVIRLRIGPLLTFLRWVYLCLAGIGNHVLLDEAKVTPYRQRDGCERDGPSLGGIGPRVAVIDRLFEDS